MSRNRKLTVMVTMALMIALNIVLGRFLSFMTLTVKLDFGFVPIATMSMMFGPIVGGVTGLLSDIIGMLIFSRGLPYFPLFTLNAFLYGVVYGIFLRKKNCKMRDILACVVVECLVIYLGLTTIWLYIFNRFLMGNDALFFTIMLERLFALCFIFPLHFLSLWLLKKQIEPRLTKALKSNVNLTDYLKKQKFDINLGLERVSKLLEYMDNPHKALKIVHITGTNGKGSVCAYMQSSLTKSGYKTGMFVSPFLLNPEEVITIDGKTIDKCDFKTRVNDIEVLQQKLKKELNQTASQFEIMTALAFLYFKDNNCDIAIVEVGLGGLGDATNIIENPLLTIISKITFDHQNYLGNTLKEIAKAKSGIIKNNTPLVTVIQEETVGKEIRRKACDMSSEIIFADTLKSIEYQNIYEVVEIEGQSVRLGLGGQYQITNASIALKALNYLKEKEGFSQINLNSVKAGFESAKNIGRFEMIAEKPCIIFDGAHNLEGINALKESVDRYFAGQNIRYLVTFMADKDIEGCLNILKNEQMCFVEFKNNERAIGAKEFFAIAQKVNVEKLEIAENISVAIDNYKNNNEVLIVCGSLYLYKEMIESVNDIKKR